MMFSMERLKEVQNETIRATKQEERVMTEQFEISKRLAEWLGLKVVGVSEPQYQNTEPMVVVQAGECLLKILATHTKKSNDELIREMLSNICSNFILAQDESAPSKSVCVDAKEVLLALEAIVKDLEFRADMKRGD